MKRIPDSCVDLIITSPPYDSLRVYSDDIKWSFEDFKLVANGLSKVLVDGGVIVWIVGDETIDGSETGSSFKQALYFKEIGFNLHDTMIWNKGLFTAVGSLRYRYASVFDYMFVLSKGKPKVFNPIKDRKNIHAGVNIHGFLVQKDGSTRRVTGHNEKVIREYGQRFNIWDITPCRERKWKHPARFPVSLAKDHIVSWSNENDLVYDPFMGSGTTAVACLHTNRKYIGSELISSYIEIARERVGECS
jgi:site-specific DNA-methyltransferase (adenine-specific)